MTSMFGTEKSVLLRTTRETSCRNDFGSSICSSTSMQMTSSNSSFPHGNEEFDEVICIEVLEHIEDPKSFLQEVSRVVRKRTLFSVPNIEVIPYFKDWEAVPWHLLEGDHKNFFTRASLRELLAPHFSRVEVFSYIEHPLRTRDGIALHAHLCAVADKAV